MKFRRFTGRDAREAMDRVRAALGSEAIILKNRSIADGVEILATLDDPEQTEKLDQEARSVSEVPTASPLPAWAAAPLPERAPAVEPRRWFDGVLERRSHMVQEISGETHGVATEAAAGRSGPLEPPLADARDAQLPPPEMSTLSFQQYLQQRVARVSTTPTMSLQAAGRSDARSSGQIIHPLPEGSRTAGAEADAPRVAFSTSPPEELMFPRAAAHSPAPMSPDREAQLMAELRSMQGMLSTHLSSMAWLDGVRRNPVQARLLRHLMACGFSGGLSRRLADRLPAQLDEKQSKFWLADRLQKVIQIDAPGQTLIDRGGIYALVGPTGVGKTTTVAKLAAQFALRHGVDSIGLVSVDAYRIGAQDQLRAFGRLLGVSVMVAHDAASLAEFLHVYMRKKLVLIDTVGFGQRDERVDEQLRSLRQAKVQRLLVLSAATQSEVMQNVIGRFNKDGLRGAVITKLDETVKAGVVLDAVIRNRLPMIGTSDGQRVPEDWQFADAPSLVARALEVPAPDPVQIEDHEMTMLLQERAPGDALHA